MLPVSFASLCCFPRCAALLTRSDHLVSAALDPLDTALSLGVGTRIRTMLLKPTIPKQVSTEPSVIYRAQSEGSLLFYSSNEHAQFSDIEMK